MSSHTQLIIIPVVVGQAITRRCVDSALAQDIGDVEVLVIGNGCVDGTIQMLSAKYWNEPRVRVIAHAVMKSLNYIWNDAIGSAFISGAEHVLVINNDIVMRPDTYRLLVADGGLFVTGVSVGSMSETVRIDTSSRSPHPAFSCFLMREECWKRVGGFDEGFWAYASDLDMHLRMDKYGVDAYAIDVPFYHETSSTLRLVDNDTRDRLQKLADADRAYFKKKYGFAGGTDEYYAEFKKQKELAR